MITGVVLARNEASNIVACLESLRPHVGELLLIDMESTDDTVKLAGPLVDGVLHHPLVPNFDAARNISIPVAKNEWLWFVDADERVSDKTGNLVNQLIKERGHLATAITIPFKSYFCGQWIQHSGWWPGYTMPRVLKRGHFEFAAEIHRGVRYDGLELRFPPDPELAIEHYSYRSLSHYVEKFNRYTSTEALNRREQGGLPDWRRGIREMARDLWLYFERQEGHRDGYLGWILAWLAGQYRWFSEAKLVDVIADASQVRSAAIPQNLDEVIAVLQSELHQLRGHSPHFPLAVHFRSPLWDSSGYADDGRALLRSLSLGKRAISAEPITWSDKVATLSDIETAFLNVAIRHPNLASTIAITNCIPSLVKPDPGAILNVLRTTFETDRIPQAWLPILDLFDEVWVCGEANALAFQRGGAAPERLRIVSQVVDHRLFAPGGATLPLPVGLKDRFVFMSVFDWQWRKGWDVLLDAYCQEFPIDDGAGLLLKISRTQGQSAEEIAEQINERLRRWGTSLALRPDIVLWDEMLSQEQIACLYRSVQAFVLPSRGEGWGRPYMEAMATALPTIGTRGSGNEAFMHDGNSFLVGTDLIPVSPEGEREIPVYRGHSWREPNHAELRVAMRRVFAEPGECELRGKLARREIESTFSATCLEQQLESHLQRLEASLYPSPPPPVHTGQIGVQLEGELFASHSFSNINEQLALGYLADESLALSIGRVRNQPTNDRQALLSHRLLGYINRNLLDCPRVTVRHAFPPNWDPPETGVWIHIQPWEFGSLPRSWIDPLQNQVTEIWVPSVYVRDVYLRSGIAASKIQVIPWGIDPQVYHLGVPQRILPTRKSFKFLYVGGTIDRKGFDVLFQAYLDEFSGEDDVSLVVKDVGTQSFYRYGNYREQILAHIASGRGPEIVYIDSEMTEGQRSSLYAACDCLVAPYRGEGFGLPVLEAMACGLPPIVPRGGPTDDFTDNQTAYHVSAVEVPCHHEWELCGTPTELRVDLADLRSTMRHAVSHRDETRRRGVAASDLACRQFSWANSIARMTQRIKSLAAEANRARAVAAIPTSSKTAEKANALSKFPLQLSVCLTAQNEESTLANCLARLRPFVRELLVVNLGSTDRTPAIAREYGAVVLDGAAESMHETLSKAIKHSSCSTTLHALSSWRPTPEFWEQVATRGTPLLMSECQANVGLLGVIIADAPPGTLPLNEAADSGIISEVNGTTPLNTQIDGRDSIVGSVRGPRAKEQIQQASQPVSVPATNTLAELARQRFAERDYFHAECYLSECLKHLDVGSPEYVQAMQRLIVCYRETGDEYRVGEFEAKLRQRR